MADTGFERTQGAGVLPGPQPAGQCPGLDGVLFVNTAAVGFDITDRFSSNPGLGHGAGKRSPVGGFGNHGFVHAPAGCAAHSPYEAVDPVSVCNGPVQRL